MVPSISSMFEIGNYKKKFIRKQQTELKFKPLNWLAIFCCTLIKYLLNMHFYSFLHANIEEIILMYKNLYSFINFARSSLYISLIDISKHTMMDLKTWCHFSMASSIFQRIFCLLKSLHFYHKISSYPFKWCKTTQLQATK